MKPKNFPGRVKRRQYEAALRKLSSNGRLDDRERAAC